MEYEQVTEVPRPDVATLPDAPGAYLFRDGGGRVIYVGKAKSLRKRLPGYWARPLHPRTEAMVEAAERVEWIVASNEVDALHLEWNLIQEHRPRFNVRYRDDKSYPYLAITESERWPRATVTRAKRRKGTRYFGPYAHAYAIRETLDSLTRVFPVRTCSNGFFDQRRRAGRPCLYYDIGRCAGPCVPEKTGVTEDGYGELVRSLGDFLAGNHRPVLRDLETSMGRASEAEEYELAARHRDRLAAARKVIESHEMVLAPREHLDVVDMAEDDLEAAFQVFFVRGGRVTGRKGWVVDRVEDLDTTALVSSFLRELYMDQDQVPPKVLVPVWPTDRDVLERWLSERRGGKVTIAVPARGDKRRLLKVVNVNAKEAFVRHKLKRATDFAARSRALNELGEVLGLPEPPLRIEAYDISNLGPDSIVGSMVVFEDGLPKRSGYRRFEIKSVPGQDDVGSMEEMLRRRFTRYLREREDPASKRKFAYPPSLAVMDGGRGQLNVALRVLEELGLDIPAVGLAKRLEEVYLPGQPEPLLIPRGSEALFLLQHVRDEAHRFALDYHRRKRQRRAMASPLDDVPGIGPARKKALLRRFGSLARLSKATTEDIAATPGVGPALAAEIQSRLRGRREEARSA